MTDGWDGPINDGIKWVDAFSPEGREIAKSIEKEPVASIPLTDQCPTCHHQWNGCKLHPCDDPWHTAKERPSGN
jgi:hypothetical protein